MFSKKFLASAIVVATGLTPALGGYSQTSVMSDSDPRKDSQVIRVSLNGVDAYFKGFLQDQTIADFLDAVMTYYFKTDHPQGEWHLYPPVAQEPFDASTKVGVPIAGPGHELIIKPSETSHVYNTFGRTLVVKNLQKTDEADIVLDRNVALSKVFDLRQMLKLRLEVEKGSADFEIKCDNKDYHTRLAYNDKFGHLAAKVSDILKESINGDEMQEHANSDVIALTYKGHKDVQLLLLTSDGLLVNEDQKSFKYLVNYFDFFQDKIQICVQFVPKELGHEMKLLAARIDEDGPGESQNNNKETYKSKLSNWNAPQCLKKSEVDLYHSVHPVQNDGKEGTPVIPEEEEIVEVINPPAVAFRRSQNSEQGEDIARVSATPLLTEKRRTTTTTKDDQ